MARTITMSMLSATQPIALLFRDICLIQVIMARGKSPKEYTAILIPIPISNSITNIIITSFPSLMPD